MIDYPSIEKQLPPKRRFLDLMWRLALNERQPSKTQRIKEWYLSTPNSPDLFEEAKRLVDQMGVKDWNEEHKKELIGETALFFLSINKPEQAIHFALLAEKRKSEETKAHKAEIGQEPSLHEVIRELSERMTRGLPLPDINKLSLSYKEGGRFADLNPTHLAYDDKIIACVVLNDYMRTRFGKNEPRIEKLAESTIESYLRQEGREPRWETKDKVNK